MSKADGLSGYANNIISVWRSGESRAAVSHWFSNLSLIAGLVSR